MKPNILVCGYSGAGKTSLIQAFCGKRVVPESDIGHGRPETMNFKAYEYSDVCFWDSKGMELGQTESEYLEYIQDFVRSRQDSDDVADHIHILWYCISGERARVMPTDLELIKNLFPITLVAVTKNDIVRRDQSKAIITALTEAGVSPENTLFTSGEKQTGLTRLLSKSMEKMPESYTKAIDLLLKIREPEFKARMDSEANDLIHWGAGRAAAISIIPIPLADMPMLIANEAYMIVRIGSVYGITVTKSILTSFLGAAGASVAGMTLASFLPFLKIGIAAGITYGIGKAAKAWFESDMSLVSDQLKDILKKNKEAASDIDWKKQAGKFNNDDILKEG